MRRSHPARTLLLKLEQRGWIQLPARRRSPTSRMRQKPLLAGDLTGQNLVLSGALAHLEPVNLVELSRDGSASECTL